MATEITLPPPEFYVRLDHEYRRHHERFRRFVMRRTLTCMECRGAGEFTEVVTDDGQGPSEGCGFCEGTGYMTPHMRGLWLRWKHAEKRQQEAPHG